MKGLAKDLSSAGEMYEPPLVIERDGKFVVYDGNRRVTCMKLFKNPKKAPSKDIVETFKKLRDTWNGDFPEQIICRVETDIDRVDEILFRRHTGTRQGVGQTKWDGRMKDNFIERTGKSSGKKIAETVRDLPRSTLNRLLSSEEFRNRVGFSFLRKKFAFTHRKEIVLVALKRIASDLASRKIVLGDLWDSARKHAYLDQLDEDGILPTDDDLLPIETGGGGGANGDVRPTSKPKPSKKPKPKPRPKLRSNLIPQIEHNIIWKDGMTRKHHIWDELEFHLDLESHPNAISVLFRVLLELSADHCSKQNPDCKIKESDKLKHKLNKLADYFYENEKIDERYRDDIKRMTRNEELVSVTSLNRFVHSYEISPSPSDLRAIWDSLEKFIKICLRETELTS